MADLAEVAPQPESRLAECVEAVLSDAEFPALSRHIQDIMEALREEDAPAHRLALVVLQDYSLTLKVLRLANSPQYNRSRTPVESVSHAIIILGVRTVRAVASTLLLFDHYEKRSHVLKQLVLLSMLTAKHAGALVEVLALENAEEVQLSAMYRNLGEILIACHFPDEYQEMLADEARGRSLSNACFRVMRFHFEELAQAVGTHWQLPPVIFEGMARTERPASVEQAAVAFSTDLTTLVYRRGVERGGTRLQLLMLRYSPWLTLNDEKIGRILDASIKRTRALFEAVNLSPADLQLRQGAEAPADAASAASTSGAGDARPVQRAATREEIDALVAEIELEITNFGPGAIDLIIELGMKTFYATGAFDRVLFAVVSTDRKELAGRFVVGDNGATLLKQFRFPLSLRGGPIALCVMRQTPLLVDRQRKPSPPELAAAETLGAQAFSVYPVSNDTDVMACFYADHTSARTGGSPSPDAVVKRVCELVSRAYILLGRFGDRVWTADEKTKVVLRILSGENVGVISRETRVPVRELDQWKKDFIDAGAAQLKDNPDTSGAKGRS